MRSWKWVALGLTAALGMAVPAEARRSAMENAPGVALVADLPDNAGFEGYSAERGSVALDLGYSYREFSAFWMPFWAYADQGLVLFSTEADGRFLLAPVTPEELARIKEITGHDYATEYRFPRHHYLWGWIPVAGVLLLLFWQRRREAKLRAAEGII